MPIKIEWNQLEMKYYTYMTYVFQTKDMKKYLPLKIFEGLGTQYEYPFDRDGIILIDHDVCHSEIRGARCLWLQVIPLG